MQTYSTFQPTGFDNKGLCAESHGIGSFLVLPCGRTRDSGVLDESNFACALAQLGGESDTVQVHRFGHWACGWFELILVDPNDSTAVDIAQNIESALEDYPVLNESDYSDREYEHAAQVWESLSVSNRVDYLQRTHGNIFAARRAELPDDPNGHLFELLTRD